MIERLAKYRWQYVMILPGAILLLLFSYIPMVGIQVAFKDFHIGSTMWSSEWVGLENFSFLQDEQFWIVVKNTIYIAILKFVFGFPAPIILALLINEVKNNKYKRFVQSVSYLPHFFSWIVVAYILQSLLTLDGGLVNQLIEKLGGDSIFFLGSTEWFRPMIVVSGLWKEVGWNTILYLAAITTIDPQLYEAARVEGAGRLAQIRNITLPGIMPTISIVLILSMPGLIAVGMDQIYPLMNPANQPVADVLDTYILRNGLQQGYFGMATAVGLLSSVISLVLVLCTNQMARKFNGEGLW
ncbi:ABC transporter permease subunit [Paenibacillus taichungensis]|jgi:putative aldouronate transport system permease protein|uniref:Sugar ABC transporter permease n=1 Tax=Paenibacillus taichungensis TaxID=484184 RepID=A0ABX2MNQ1_9BACL|nr:MULTISPECIES: ABC transporter permease subunit [Paenibacillus]OME82736.1 protein lplB [Paenibacillus pabuli]MDR9746391.1 ABC transporter permease subunit [Paenibacillus taichungensis]MEC0111345.1 ABC transporter permease subunit [Paenibacillus taichungensis]MEC0198904.1 ABC transporter permease subunit [Paenibacillus taichungensis]NUU55682.1 sugar ABC transporter permease [Paenibacillus taichungensis]